MLAILMAGSCAALFQVWMLNDLVSGAGCLVGRLICVGELLRPQGQVVCCWEIKTGKYEMRVCGHTSSFVPGCHVIIVAFSHTKAPSDVTPTGLGLFTTSTTTYTTPSGISLPSLPPVLSRHASIKYFVSTANFHVASCPHAPSNTCPRPCFGPPSRNCCKVFRPFLLPAARNPLPKTKESCCCYSLIKVSSGVSHGSSPT